MIQGVVSGCQLLERAKDGVEGGGGAREGDLTIKPLVGMHGPVPEVLPAVAKENGDTEPGGGLQEPVNDFGD